MSPGAVSVVLDVNAAGLANAVEAACLRLEVAAAGTAGPSSATAALLGAAAAAVELKRPVTRRALLFPWLGRGRA